MSIKLIIVVGSRWLKNDTKRPVGGKRKTLLVSLKLGDNNEQKRRQVIAKQKTGPLCGRTCGESID